VPLSSSAEVQQLNIKPFHVTLTRNAKGRYQWEISVHTDIGADAYAEAVNLDSALRKEYEGQLGGEE
jgi:hypothetical protein